MPELLETLLELDRVTKKTAASRGLLEERIQQFG
jgi:2-dehydro-3-deoxyphosphooctonate aldolase (KDO 8-P synthase)